VPALYANCNRTCLACVESIDNLVDEIRLSKSLIHPHIVQMIEFEYKPSIHTVRVPLHLVLLLDSAPQHLV
jgi:hypothetical protein